MVERPEPGIYTMNIGNLLAGESATVEIEFAELLDWSNDRLRLALPMTIAPRYGEERGALEPHAQPHIDLATERAFDLELRVRVDGKVSSPSHTIATGRSQGDLVVSLRHNSAWMDRDFVLMVQSQERPKPFAVIASDGDAHVGYVSFQIPEAKEAPGGRDVRLLIDCSGSMAGNSIALARQGAINLLNRLREKDRFAIVAFGSTAKEYRKSLADATRDELEKAIAWVQGLEADLGGTELAKALDAAMELRGARSAADIFLVTDGQVGESARTVEKAAALGHRVFVVGIGVSPSRGLLEEISGATGGAIDYVGAGEDVAHAIGRQFARITQVPVSEIAVEWSDATSEWRTGLEPTIFSGSTVHAFCAVKGGGAQHKAVVHYRVGNAPPFTLEVGCVAVDAETLKDLPRIAASERIRRGQRAGTMDAAAADALALIYQLVTARTNYVLVIDREDAKASDMPEITPVRTMLAAGWGGTGDASIGDLLCSFDDDDVGAGPYRVERTVLGSKRRVAAHEQPSRASFMQEVNHRYGSLTGPDLPLTIDEVVAMNLPVNVGDFLRKLIRDGRSEEDVMRAFWLAYAKLVGLDALSRGLMRRIRATARGDHGLHDQILAAFQAVETA